MEALLNFNSHGLECLMHVNELLSFVYFATAIFLIFLFSARLPKRELSGTKTVQSST